MSMASEEVDSDGYMPTYRQADVDGTLEDHEMRLSRLEKAALVGAGYILGTASISASDIIGAFFGFL